MLWASAHSHLWHSLFTKQLKTNMDIKDIKIGETYNVRVKVRKIENGKHVITDTLDSDGCINSACTTTFLEQELSAFSPITPAPKYDPCRKFRKGDIVEPTEINGRLPQELRGCYRYKVIVGEGEMAIPLYVALKPLLAANVKHLSEIHVNAAFLKLVTPVEEKEPYFVEESNDGATIVLTVKKRGCSQGLDFRYCPGWGGNVFLSENHFRKHAEDECDRLNAEYRKEQQ